MATAAESSFHVESWLDEIGLPIIERADDAFVISCPGDCGGRRLVNAATGKSDCNNCSESLFAIALTSRRLGIDLKDARAIVEKHKIARQPSRESATAGASTKPAPKASATDGLERFRQPVEILDRTPPTDLAAERAVLSSLLIDGRRMPEVLEELADADDFRDPQHRRVYEAMVALHRSGQPVELLFVHDALVANGALGDVGVSAFLQEVFDDKPTADNARFYAKLVADKAALRRLRDAGQELLRISADGSRLGANEALREARAIFDHAARLGGNIQGGLAYDWRTFAELQDDQTTQRYLVEDVVTEAQGGLVSGRFKTLKTSIAEELNASMATGTPFLGKFEVPEPIPCAMMTAESGPATVRETLCRIAAAKGVTRSELSDRLLISTKLPALASDDHLEAIERDIRKYGLRCLTIDPSYLAFSEVGDSASNVFRMGAVLSRITKIIQDTGCSILLLNHTTKARGKDIGKTDPPELGEVAMSGFAEWARFWILLAAQREWDEHAGRHYLWMRTGGSAGHSGLWSLDITEGRRGDPGGRKWEVEIATAADAARERIQDDENKKAAQTERKEAEYQRKVADALKEFPDGETGKVLREAAGLSGGNFGTAIRALLKCGKAEQTQVPKNGKMHDGYRPKK